MSALTAPPIQRQQQQQHEATQRNNQNSDEQLGEEEQVSDADKPADRQQVATDQVRSDSDEDEPLVAEEIVKEDMEEEEEEDNGDEEVENESAEVDSSESNQRASSNEFRLRASRSRSAAAAAAAAATTTTAQQQPASSTTTTSPGQGDILDCLNLIKPIIPQNPSNKLANQNITKPINHQQAAHKQTAGSSLATSSTSSTSTTTTSKLMDPQQMHVCRLCDKLLSSSSSLDRHMLTHSGERPFVCKRCHMTFTTNGKSHLWPAAHVTQLVVVKLLIADITW